MFYLITNRKMIKSGTLEEMIEKCAHEGMEAVILREKDLSTYALFSLASSIKEISRQYNFKLIVNDNLKVAQAIRADYFHIGYEKYCREKIKIRNIPFGMSVHSLEEALFASGEGASYLLVSHIFATDCKKGLKAKGIELIEEIKSHVSIPVIALGGINEGNKHEVLNAGTDGIAVMSYIMAAEDPEVNLRKLKE